MGWMIKMNKNKYRIWSTVVDDYITDSMDKDELLRYLFWNKFEFLIKEMTQEMICFPHHWTDIETGEFLRCDENNLNEFFNIVKDKKKMYIHFLRKLKDIGISLNISDIKNDIKINTESNE